MDRGEGSGTVADCGGKWTSSKRLNCARGEGGKNTTRSPGGEKKSRSCDSGPKERRKPVLREEEKRAIRAAREKEKQTGRNGAPLARSARHSIPHIKGKEPSSGNHQERKKKELTQRNQVF